MAKIHQLGFRLVSHAPYLADLTPSNLRCFPNLEKFVSDLDVTAVTMAYFKELDNSAYIDGIRLLSTDEINVLFYTEAT